MGIDLKIKDPSEGLVEVSNDAIKTALQGKLEKWMALLAENSEIDGFDLLFRSNDSNLTSIIEDAKGRPSLDWLVRLSRASSTPRRGVHSEQDMLLSELWRSLQRKVTNLLQSRTRDLPEKGYALYFTEGLQWCIVFSYKFSGNAATARVVHYTKEPQSVYDIFALSHMSDEHTRTIIKNVVRSRSKVIIHRNVLIEVDRYLEAGVFGPTIDTLYLHEFLARLFAKSMSSFNFKQVTSAMEIGSGNGMLTAGLSNKCKNLEILVAVDTNIKAIKCTTRNVGHATARRNGFLFYAICGEFNSELLKNKFDLVLSNPPYLPYREDDIEGDENSQRIAIKGTELIEEIVKNSPFYLSHGGALIIVYSELAERELIESIPEEMVFVSANRSSGYRVLFDLEEVMDNPRWLNFLEDRGLAFDSASKAYHHHLKIGIITHSTQNEPIPHGAIAGAFANW